MARAAMLVQERSTLDTSVLVNLASTSDRGAIYAATGGRRVSEDEIREIQIGVRQIASGTGYPDISVRTQAGDGEFDARTAGYLFESMEISAAEAARTEVWSFLGCAVLPDIVRWRFPGGGSGSTPERFAGNGGVVRNTLGRLWWRAAVLREAEHLSPFHLISELGEDEMVQIMERPALSGFPQLAVSISNNFLRVAAESRGQTTRSDLMREMIKRVRRLRSIISFESLLDNELNETVQAAVSASAFALTGGGAGQDERAPDAVETEVEEVRPTERFVAGQDTSDSSVTIPVTLNRRNVGAYLASLNLDVRDRLDLGGNLWVLGDRDMEVLIAALEGKNLQFKYRPGGGRGTGYAPAWLLETWNLDD
jgi:hypothetical protein